MPGYFNHDGTAQGKLINQDATSPGQSRASRQGAEIGIWKVNRGVHNSVLGSVAGSEIPNFFLTLQSDPTFSASNAVRADDVTSMMVGQCATRRTIYFAPRRRGAPLSMDGGSLAP